MKKILSISLIALSAFAYNLAPAQLKTIDITKTYSGDTYAKEQVMVSTRLMGYIKKINVEEGDVVKKGELLFEVDPSDIYSMINQARAGVLQAQNAVLMAELAYADAKKDYDRFSNLYKQGSISKRDFDKMTLNMKMRKSQVEMAKAMLAQAKAGLEQALSQQKYAKVYSPIDGVVIRKLANVGDMSLPGHPVVILANLNSVQARAFVKAEDVKLIKKGQDAEVYISALDEKVPAQVSSIILSGDMATHSYLVKFKFLQENKDILPGMYAKIRVKIGSKKEVVVPYDALTSRGGIIGVFVDNNGKAEFRPVKILSQDGNNVAVTNVQAGEEVVVLPPANMTDSTPLN
ncbi:MAG: efflux RND transporter periplasmic adaptor subunit [Nautilia sp.]|nr:MAG: efflux RND transporter periplasmic adaptor subunit [Nautilia sp.]